MNSSITTPLSGTAYVAQGSSTALTIVASGTPPITYQWYYNGTAITGATNASYSKTWIATDGGIYKVVVTNPTGKDSSSTQLTVAPVITTGLGANSSVTQAGNTALTVTATGTASITYQWYYNGTAITGATNASYSKTWAATDGGTYKVVASNAAGKDSSTTQVTVSPLITAALGANTSIAISTTTALAVTAAGTAPLTYQWYLNGTAITGATSSSYSKTPSWGASDGGVYKVVVTNAAGSDSSKTTVTINSSISTPLAATTYVAQGSATPLTIVASGTPPITYQWYYNGTAITSATNASYFKTWGAGDGGVYKIVVTNGTGKDSSSTQLVVAPVITSALGATTNVSQGGSTMLSVTATGTLPLSYQWYLSGTAIPGATLSSYTKSWTATDGGVYKVVASNAAGSDSSKTTLTVAPVITSRLTSTTSFNQGSSGSLSITATGTAPITYQWTYNGGTISASSSYTTTWQYANAGTYKVSATNLAGTDTSSTVVSVKDVTPPSIILKRSLDTTIAIGSTWTEPGDSAWDDKDGVITNRIVVSNLPNTSASGKFTVTYNVSDAAGNAATAKTRTVRVVGWELVTNTGISVANYWGFQLKLINNNLYIAYVDNSDNLTYVKKLVGSSWQPVGGGPVDYITTDARMVSLAVSPDGSTPYIAYISSQTTNQPAIVSRLQSGSWGQIYSSQYDYSSAQYAEVEVAPDGSVYLLLWPQSGNPEVVMKYNPSTTKMDSLIGIYPQTNYYPSEIDYHAIACASDGTPYVTYRGPGGFTIKKRSGSTWIGAGPTAADSVFSVAYSTPLQTFFSGSNLFVLVSNAGQNPTFYDLKSGVWSGNLTITTNGSDHPCLSGISDTAYISYASYQNYAQGPVYVNEVVNGTVKPVPEISSTGLAIPGTFNYSWVEAGPGIVYAVGRDYSTGAITLMKYVKQ
jgi:hypothetical protein